MQFPHEIEKRLKKQPKKKSFINLVYFLMKDLHQPYSDILRMPMPLINALAKTHESIKKKEAEQYKKAKAKRR